MRKNTLKVFHKKKIEESTNRLHKGEYKDDVLKPGKIYINEFWSDKYQQKILKDSHIKE
jgi:hypothetical protein